MSAAEILIVAPLLAFLAGGVVVLLLEAVGTPLGAQKTGHRTHLAVIALGAVAAAVTQLTSTLDDAALAQPAFGGLLVFDRLAVLGQLAVSCFVALGVVAAVPRLRELQAERGDSYALLLALGVAHCVAVATDDLLVLATALLVASMVTAAFCSLDRTTQRSAEAAIKETKSAGVSLVLLTFAAALTYGASGGVSWSSMATVLNTPAGVIAAACVLIVILGRAMATPLNMPALDVAQGAPPFAGALASALNLTTAAVILARASDIVLAAPPSLKTVLTGIAVLTLLLPGILALDQRRVPRVFAHLLACGTGPVLVAALTSDAPDILFAAIVTGVAGASAIAAVGIFERVGVAGSTWERYSGVGRRYPYYALAILWMLASLVGFPGTVGFSARLFIATKAFGAGHDLLGVTVLGGIAIATAPVLRLGILMFARTPERPPRAANSPWRTAVFALGSLLLLAGTIGASALHELLGGLLR